MSTSTALMSPAQPRWLTSMTSSVFLSVVNPTHAVTGLCTDLRWTVSFRRHPFPRPWLPTATVWPVTWMLQFPSFPPCTGKYAICILWTNLPSVKTFGKCSRLTVLLISWTLLCARCWISSQCVDVGSVEPDPLHGIQRSARSYVTLSRADVQQRGSG